MKPTPRDRLIVALDVPDIEQASAMVQGLGPAVTFYKIGMQLGFAGGLDLARRLAADGKQVFLDMKLLDIANTVEKGIESIIQIGATFTTVHAYPQTMRAAVKARGRSGLKILGVTVLTSLDRADLIEAGYDSDPRTLVLKRAGQAVTCGVDGVVASAQEARAIRDAVGRDLLIVTPGIRPAGTQAGDQKRVTTPADAIRA
ncbi:MAG: orotidine-5'-phosphate decarboxylase, partial [Fimbriimonadaceae bacterium]|nr:orotidine-5'-phosphate decarboxylase [Alphaproteobacteria bacterium]